ncbi:MAG TPA: MBL fold metallo-hydrolase [Burkholderiales bacterium]|jgi:L-ascorbate metabolism protein UlaG (beta-lactamase superfamily)|nr:MBL fold metallo-hydrolase [Burkholderiales bacterium]
MKKVEAGNPLILDPRRRTLLRGMAALGGALALGACGSMEAMGPGSGGSARLSGGRLSVRWLGGGVAELATPDYRQIAYADAWFWHNSGWTPFNVPRPAEYGSAAAFAQYVRAKNPQAVLVMLTHDHGDHIGDYFESLKALADAGIPVLTTGQSDLMRSPTGLVPDFKKAGLEPAKIVANGGAGMNFGGITRHGAMSARLVPAVHSTLHAYPAVGFMLDLGGVRTYISGDTDLFSEMKTLGERYQPNLALICVGDGPYTMGPEEAARACQWLGVSHAIPYHYAHNPAVKGVGGGEEFRKAMAAIAPSVKVTVMKPGETVTIQT